MTVRNLLEAFFRRRAAIIIIALISACIIVVGTLYRIPQYMSETRFMIPIGRELGTPTTPTAQAQAMVLMMNYTDQIATQMEVLNNRRLVEDAIAGLPRALLAKSPPQPPIVGMVREARARIDAWLGRPGAAGRDAGTAPEENSGGGISLKKSLRNLLERSGILHPLTGREQLVLDCAGSLKIERQNESGVIHATFTSPSPEFAQVFLMKFLDAYENLRASSGVAESDMPFYADQESHLRDSLRNASDRLAEFRKEWGLLDIRAQREQYTTELARLDQIINESRSDATRASAFLTALQTDEGKREPENVLSRVMRDDPGMVHNLRSMAALLARESRLLAEVGPKHPELVLIQSEMRELRDGLYRNAVGTLEAQILNARVMLEETTRQRNEAEDRMATLEAKTVEMSALESEVKVAGDALLAYGRSRESARVTSQMDTKRVNTVMVIEPPTRPYGPKSPKPFRDIALGLVFSVLLGLYYAYFMESFSDTVYNLDAVATKFPDTALVSIPEVKKTIKGEIRPPENALAMLGRKFFYKNKKLNLPKSLLVVGANAKAGATSLSKMLAEYMAGTYNIRVLWVDAHLSPKRGQAPGDPDVATLSAWLIDRTVQPEACPPGEVRFLEAGPSGPEVRAAMLRISAEDLAALGDFETIIFDAAPLNLDSVTFHLAALTEATLPVVGMEHTRKAVLASMQDDLSQSGATVLGVVCNRRRFYIPQWIYKRLS